ncbi:YdgA family protein [Pseudomonas sp. RIT-PI-AD]|uniref:YdgA family protein n=1 Tax=Pseudomonas sp. RIT-PI-AD TaxID=3035294 RepID=UPI0021D7E52F|nr:YdgA family protein [Pseudomonas sp. RIT-PI-AD]
MNKSAGIAVGIIVVAGAAITAAAWYTGSRLEGVLQTSLVQANQALQGVMPGAGLQLTSLETGVFGSTAHYRFTYKGELKGEMRDVELLLVDEIDHGPFPLSRLKALKLMPVMAASNYRLERNPLVDKWFEATGGASPLVGQASIGYDESVEGTGKLLPFDSDLDAQTHLTLSGLEVTHSNTREAQRMKFDARMDSLRMTAQESTTGPVDLAISGLQLSSDYSKGLQDLYLGASEVRIKQAQIAAQGKPPITFRDFVENDSLQQEGDKVAARMGYDIGMLGYDGKDVGALQMIWSLKNLDGAALKSLGELYTAYAAQTQVKGQENAELSAEQKVRLQADLKRLLAAKPSVALETLSLKTPHGESRFNLSLNLAQPDSFEQPADRLAKQIIEKLDARLSVAKGSIGDLAALQSDSSDPQAIAQEAAAATEMASGMALATGMATLQGEDLVSSLAYADGQVDFNGNRSSLQAFLDTFLGMAGAPAGVLPQGADEDSGEEPDEPPYEDEAAPEAE